MFAHLPGRFGSIAPVGWSVSDSDFEENDAKAINTKRLSLSFASDSKGLKQRYRGV